MEIKYTTLVQFATNWVVEFFSSPYVDAINNNFVFTAYFVDAKRKFADVEYYVSEYSFQEYDYTSYPYQLKTITEYWISPRFVLSDGSKVDVDEYFSKGFDKIIERIQNMEIDF